MVFLLSIVLPFLFCFVFFFSIFIEKAKTNLKLIWFYASFETLYSLFVANNIILLFANKNALQRFSWFNSDFDDSILEFLFTILAAVFLLIHHILNVCKSENVWLIISFFLPVIWHKTKKDENFCLFCHFWGFFLPDNIWRFQFLSWVSTEYQDDNHLLCKMLPKVRREVRIEKMIFHHFCFFSLLHDLYYDYMRFSTLLLSESSYLSFLVGRRQKW